jgi:hypothetical protein
MSFKLNELLQTACEDLNLADEPISGELAADAEGCFNRALTGLNSDGYISLTMQTYDRTSAGNVVFKKLEEGEPRPANVIDEEPPDAVDGVSRQVGQRWLKLRPVDPQFLSQCYTGGLPQFYFYGTDTETAPSGNTRAVGTVHLNGNYPDRLRIFVNSAIPHYKLGDTIYLSSLYYNLLLYATEAKLVDKHKLYSYSDKVELELSKAMKAIDTNHVKNQPDMYDGAAVDSYLSPYYDFLGGAGM